MGAGREMVQRRSYLWPFNLTGVGQAGRGEATGPAQSFEVTVGLGHAADAVVAGRWTEPGGDPVVGECLGGAIGRSDDTTRSSKGWSDSGAAT
jgi:hypothetical protein